MVLAVHKWTQSTHQSRRTLFPIKWHHRTTQQWRTLCTSSRTSCHQPPKQNCGTLHHGARSGIHQNHPWRIRPHATSHATTTDNAMADAVINGKIQRFHWLRDRKCQQQFKIYWRPSKLNYADYWTKHHPESHHRNIRKEFPTPTIVIQMLRIEQQLQQKVACAAWFLIVHTLKDEGWEREQLVHRHANVVHT